MMQITAETESHERLVRRFHEQMVELIKKYQFRDRGASCCLGMSVSQCYILETLWRQGPLAMNELAECMRLSVSTVTRVVDQLEKKDLVRRSEGRKDRRIRRLSLTPAGEAMFHRLWASVLQSEKEILDRFPEDRREMLIQFLEMLNQSVDGWRAECQIGEAAE